MPIPRTPEEALAMQRQQQAQQQEQVQQRNARVRAVAERDQEALRNSQAGLGAIVGGQARSLPSVPAPGEPGSRFNPVVRERQLPIPRVEQQPLPAAPMIEVPEHLKPSQLKPPHIREAEQVRIREFNEFMREVATGLPVVNTGFVEIPFPDPRDLQDVPELQGEQEPGEREQALPDIADKELHNGGTSFLMDKDADSEYDGVADATVKGFAKGFTRGLGGGAAVSQPESDQTKPDKADDLAASKEAQEKLYQRFPELREAQVPESGSLQSRFPELRDDYESPIQDRDNDGREDDGMYQR